MQLKWARGLIVICTFSIILSLGVSATYVDNGSIVLVRSQFLNESIEIDGKLTDSSWSKSGTMEVLFENPDEFALSISYLNIETDLFVGISLDLKTAENHSFLLTFDVDGDGSLNAPEDAKFIQYLEQIFDPSDYYWDGDNWVKDGLLPGIDDEFEVSSSFTNEQVVHEMRIGLTSSNTRYDGFRIANPTNTFIGFNVEFSRNNGSAVNYFSFPTVSSNSSGYVDLKLAGPEDNDLPEYSPPTTQITEAEPTYTEYADSGGLGFAPFSIIFPLTAVFLVYFTIRRRKR